MWYYLGKNKNTGNTGNKIQEKFSGLLVIGKIQELCEWLEISFLMALGILLPVILIKSKKKKKQDGIGNTEFYFKDKHEIQKKDRRCVIQYQYLWDTLGIFWEYLY